MGKTRIIVEATGGDSGYKEVARGAELYLEENHNVDLFLAAGKDKLKEDGYLTDSGELTDAAIPKGMDRDHIILTERTFYYPDKTSYKPSSIYRALNMHHSKEMDAVIAPGDTYSTVTYSSWRWKHEKIGEVRPAIAVDFSGNVLIDAGANIECEPKNYQQFAVMGSVISRYKLGIKDPLVGVVTNGTEFWKGNEAERRSLPLLEKLREKGYDITEGFFEPHILRDPERKGFRSGLVLVTNGLVGNAILKTAEMSFEVSGDLISQAYHEEPWWSRDLGALTFDRIRNKLRGKVDYSSFGVAPLYGYNNAEILVGHGRSKARAIARSVGRTLEHLTFHLNDRLREELERLKI